jgi:hypothetical protein
MKTWTWFLLGIGIIGLGVGAFNTASGRAPWDFTDDEPTATGTPVSPGAAVDAPNSLQKYTGLFDTPPSKPGELEDPSMPNKYTPIKTGTRPNVETYTNDGRIILEV